MKNAVIGCISGYKKSDIKYWCESLDKVGFSGDKIMIVYPEIHQETLDYLRGKNFEIYQASQNTNLYDDRFLMINLVLSQKSYEYIVHCDVKDAVFQSNPFDWLEKNLKDKKAVVGSESVSCKNMPWAVENYSKTFPYEWERIKDKNSFCCGVIAGRFEFLRDFFLILWRYNQTGNKFYDGWWRDQAALNILLNTLPIEESFYKSFHDDGFVCHLGAKINNDKKYLLEDYEPTYTEEGFVKNKNNKNFCIVHQYDRIEELKNKIHEFYDQRTNQKN